ncbi:MAG: hypothetical protein HY762_06040, partial [Planctomycetes bacterium]|nr:hypothetical protein [Planctomycetota bacterium]
MNQKWLSVLLAAIMVVGWGSLAMASDPVSDPAGRVFDSVTGEVITGAVVTLVTLDGGAITPTPPVGTTGTNPQTVGPFGFSWAAQEGKSFALSVTAIGYQCPTVQTTWQSAW